MQQIHNSVVPVGNSSEALSAHQLQPWNFAHNMPQEVSVEQTTIVGGRILLQRLADMISMDGARHIMIIGGPGMVHPLPVMHMYMFAHNVSEVPGKCCALQAEPL